MYKLKKINETSLKKLKLKLAASIFLLVLAIAAIFIFDAFSFRQAVLALTGNYSKITGDKLTLTDWNNLDDDFVAKSGSTMIGNLNMGNKSITSLAAPTNGTDAANKTYVDSKVVGGGGTGLAKKYTVVYTLRSGSCLPGYTEETVSSIKSYDDYVYTFINSAGFWIGSVSTPSYALQFIYMRFHKDYGPTKICSKIFDTTSRPYISAFLFDTDNSANCPTGYNYLPHDQLKGNNDYAYINANSDGAYIGPMDGWDFNAQPYKNGYIVRQWHSGVAKGLCFKILGVEGDPSASGVYPIFLGPKDSGTCATLGAGWTNYDTSTFHNAGWSTVQWGDSGSIIGPATAADSGWWGGGENQSFTYFHDTHNPYLCYKYFNTIGEPHVTIRMLNSGNCPAGFKSVDGGNLLSPVYGSAYYFQTGYGLWAGGLYSWGGHGTGSYLKGSSWNSWSSQVSKFCFRVDNEAP
jgi:hypothetical protein